VDTESLAPGAFLPFPWESVFQSKEISDWQIVDLAEPTDIGTAKLTTIQDLDADIPFDAVAFSLFETGGRTNAPKADVADSNRLIEITDQKRRRRKSRAVLKGTNKFGRSGSLRCELCRSWRQGVEMADCYH